MTLQESLLHSLRRLIDEIQYLLINTASIACGTLEHRSREKRYPPQPQVEIATYAEIHCQVDECKYDNQKSQNPSDCGELLNGQIIERNSEKDSTESLSEQVLNIVFFDDLGMYNSERPKKMGVE
jgi:hypothetical protein